MKVNKQFIKHIAKLSRFDLTEDELKKFTSQMKTILDSAEVLQKVDLTDVSKEPRMVVDFKELREDKAQESLSQIEAIKNAPFVEDGYIKSIGGTFEEKS